MSCTIVTNSGPLILFAKLNILHLIKEVYGKILFPKAVYNETVVDGIRHGFFDAYTLRLFLSQNRWNPTEVSVLPSSIVNTNLDRGEQEAIALALLKKAMVLMDEEYGRNIARQHGLKVKGSLGVLIESYRKKLITKEQLKFYFAQIGERNDIWISSKLCKCLLSQIYLKNS